MLGAYLLYLRIIAPSSSRIWDYCLDSPFLWMAVNVLFVLQHLLSLRLLSYNSLHTFSATAQDGICMHRYVVHHQLRIVQSSIAVQAGISLQGLLQTLRNHILNAASPSLPNFLPLLQIYSTP